MPVVTVVEMLLDVFEIVMESGSELIYAWSITGAILITADQEPEPRPYAKNVTVGFDTLLILERFGAPLVVICSIMFILIFIPSSLVEFVIYLIRFCCNEKASTKLMTEAWRLGC